VTQNVQPQISNGNLASLFLVLKNKEVLRIPTATTKDGSSWLVVSGFYNYETKTDVKRILEGFGEISFLRAGSFCFEKYNYLLNKLGSRNKVTPTWKVVFGTSRGASECYEYAEERLTIDYYDPDLNDSQFNIYEEGVLKGMYKIDEMLRAEIAELDHTEDILNLAVWIENLRSPRFWTHDIMQVHGVGTQHIFTEGSRNSRVSENKQSKKHGRNLV